MVCPYYLPLSSAKLNLGNKRGRETAVGFVSGRLLPTPSPPLRVGGADGRRRRRLLVGPFVQPPSDAPVPAPRRHPPSPKLVRPRLVAVVTLGVAVRRTPAEPTLRRLGNALPPKAPDYSAGRPTPAFRP